MPKIRNIIIFVVIAVAFGLAYVLFSKSSSSNTPNLVSSTGEVGTQSQNTDASAQNGTSVAQNFLTILLGVKTIKLNVNIFSDPAFIKLHDSSITLAPDTTIGRLNPFAKFGAGDVSSPATTTSTLTTDTNGSNLVAPTTPIAPAKPVAPKNPTTKTVKKSQ